LILNKRLKMKIGIDIDDVVVEFVRGFCEFLSNIENNSFKIEKTAFVFENAYTYDLGKLMGISKEEENKLINDFNKSENFSNLDFLPGAKENISSLENGDNKIFFITSRPLSVEKQTRDFFKKNFPKNNFELYFSGEKWGKLKSKGEICSELGVEVMIEDNAYFALDCAKKGIKTFLLDKPWNQDYEKHENIIRVKDWEEIMNHLNKLIYKENAN